MKENDVSKIENASIEEQRSFLTTNLKQILKDLSPGFRNPAFRSFIINEMQKKFDGKAHILIRTILSNPQFDGLINKQSLWSTLKKFENIAGENLYPQLYVANFDKFYSLPRIETVNVDEFVFYDGNDTSTVSKVDYLNEDGELIDKGFYADETYAKNNEVFIVSINETVNNDGGIPVSDTLRPIEISYNPDDTIPSTESIINARIKDVTVWDSMESWLAGDSEVNIKAWLSHSS